MINLIAHADSSQLIVVDMQSRLATVMVAHEMQSVIKNACVLAQAAKMLNLPTVLTEQYPKGLGNTIPELLAAMPAIKPIEKLTFSCMADATFTHQLTRNRSQIILVGMEAHICILQTALSMVASGKQVFVVEDAIMSRNAANKANAIARMRDAGCIISNTESVVFEWLGIAQGDAFKAISKLIR